MSDNNDHAASTASRPPSFQLTPSQALKPANPSLGNKSDKGAGNSSSNTDGNSKNRNKNKNRRRRNAKTNNTNNLKSPPSTEEMNNNVKESNDAPDAQISNLNSTKKQNNKNSKKSRQLQRQRQKQRGDRKGGDGSNEKRDENGDDNTDLNANEEPQPTKKSNRQQTNAKSKNQRRKAKKKYPWRRHIPDGTVDPITLDDLNTLEYPPFALCADEPYVPISEWPIPSDKPTNVTSNSQGNNNGGQDSSSPPGQGLENADELNRQRLADQWGEQLLPSGESSAVIVDGDKKPEASTSTTPQTLLSQRPLNLFDGRALAFYMVSQLQFIDPFTRRDLTRAELQNLDRYLERYGNLFADFENKQNNENKRNSKKKKQKLKVTDAYDAKGITLSSAGAAAATAQGRADIMQQTAQQLLNSLFVGQTSVSAISPDRNNERPSRRQQAENFSLQEQYAATQRQEREAAEAGERQYEREAANVHAGHFQNNSVGFGGFMVIDDDENPEMRGRSHNNFPSLSETATASSRNGPAFGETRTSPFYSAAHIAGRQAGRPPATDSGAFPALPRPSAEASRQNTVNSKKSKTLAKISRFVKKTTEEERQSQWEAREAARKKAMMSNLIFGLNPVTTDPSRSLLVPPASGATSGTATEEQMQRNRAFAEALGVKPATQRHYASGWARPTSTQGAGNTAVLDELEAALYPEALIVSARVHRMDFLLKLEKKWKKFLNDDKAASLPLNRMNRSARKFVHEYAEFWKLKTESFDPEPNRYIHCVKLRDTRMPHPLLSDIARNWRGPDYLPLPDASRTISSVMNDHTSHQTAGQTSRSPFEAPVPRTTPPVAKLRSATAMSSSKGDLVALGEATVQNSRSGALMDKERPQLKLAPRSVPLQLPPFEEQLQQEAMAGLDLDEDIRKRQIRMEEKKRQERDIEQKKKKVLEDVFASDDESDGRGTALYDDDEDWVDEQEALYTGSDED
eukprot:CAMPEP_0197179576 /NCGR_PEP_ID=MMETSP1423-20130617/4464_1 /TAXON_ID=476441 /ORGANISM="Pseudo-nitzschia heimii, Strain UNC1101" /LENGTH=968 /DNA_ID=CAMNT_0042629499 /DNA_START=350 /DNA_END=3256 /DNA_ORIENTATION=+